MPLEIVTGRKKSGKSEYIYKKISRMVSDGKEVILIVPEQFSHLAEKRLLSYVNAITDNKAEVFSFKHLAMVTEARLNMPNVSPVTPVGKAVLISNILKENTFEFYKNAGEQNGFVDMASSAIGEFKKYMILPETLTDTAKSTDDVVLGMKLRDLSLIYSEYEKAISLAYRDGDDYLTLLSKNLLGSEIYSNKYVFIDEFSTFVPQELQVIDILCKKCAGVCVSMCYDENEINTTLFSPTSDTIKKLLKNNSSTVTYTKLNDTFYLSEEIGHLEKNLYTFPCRQYEKQSSDIKVYGLSNPLSEVEVCATNILSLVRDKGYKFSDIGVLCSDISLYERHIQRVFGSCDIEYFLDDKDSIINHHLIKFVLGLIEIYIKDYTYESIFNYLKASFIDAEPSSIALLEKFIQKSKLRRTTWLNDEKWNTLTNANFPNDESVVNSLNELREKFILPIANMHESIKGRHSVREFTTTLYDFLLKLKMPDTIAGYIKFFNDLGELRLSKEYEKIWQIIIDTFDELVSLCGSKTLSVSGYYDLLVTAFSQHKVGFIPTSIDRVVIGNTERSRFDGIKALFVLGVNEGIFPVSPKDDGVLGDSDKELMRDSGVEFSTTSEISAYYSQFSAYSSFATPTKLLFVSYHKAGNDFKSMRKSYILNRILKMFSIKEISEASLPEMMKISSLTQAKQALSDNVAKYEENTKVDDLWRNVYEYYLKNTDFIQKLESFSRSDNLMHALSRENLMKLLPILSYTSVSKIERYMVCNYAYFIDYVLRIQPSKEDTVDALDIGNVTHNILEALCKEFGSSKARFENTNDEEVLSKIEYLLEEYVLGISKVSDDMSQRDRYTLQRLKNSIFFCFNAVRNQFINSGFEPLGYEIEFNDNSPLGSIKIETLQGNTLNLTGKIDRADIAKTEDGTFVRVIDYKTGNKDFKLDEVLYGLSVQLLVYLNKLVGSNPDYNYGGALYFPVSDVMIKRDGHTADIDITKEAENELKLKGIVPFEEAVLKNYDDKIANSLKRTHKDKRITLSGFETIDKYVNHKIGLICDDIINGKFDISPYKKKDFTPCEYCKYGSVCRFDSLNGKNEYRIYKPNNSYDDILSEMEAQTGGQD